MAMTTDTDATVDPRRSRRLRVRWAGGMTSHGAIGTITIDGELWAAVEWSEQRQAWCIEDSEGRCLSHKASIRGQAASKEEAVALAKAMIADGRMPSPEEARAQRQAAAEKRATPSQKPANVRARQKAKEKRDHSAALFSNSSDARYRDKQELPLWESLADAFDFSDPNLWRSNSFASLRPRLVIWMRRVVAKLEYDVDYAGKRHKPYGGSPEPADWPARRVAPLMPKLLKAREILALLEGDQPQSQAAE